MDKKYIELFKNMAHATEVTAERVMEFNRAQKDEAGEKTAQIMRDDFATLYNKMSAEDFDGTLTKAEYSKLLVGCFVIANNIQDKIVNLQNALAGYKDDVIPKLDEIVNQTKTDEEAQAMADQKFIIENKD